MKTNFLLRFVMLLALTGCDLALEPYNGRPADRAFDSVEGLRAATIGNYQFLVAGDQGGFDKVLFTMNEWPADNVSYSGVSAAPSFYIYSYSDYPNMGYIPQLWAWSYRVIYGANQVIEHLPDPTTPELKQLKGENLFLRAWAHYELVNLFGRPYVQGRNNLGVPILDSTEKAAGRPSRNTVGEVYDFVIGDLKQAADLMTIPRDNSRASKEAAYALLSRVYLNMGDNPKAIEYASKVISSGRYHLADTKMFMRSNEIAPESNPGVIFAIKHTVSDIKGWAALGSQYYKSPTGVGWGEMYASESYRKLLDRYLEDARHAFVVPNYKKDGNGAIVRDKAGNPVLQTRNGYPQYFITKFSNQEGQVLLSSPVILRLAEMYLNRAEANARLGNDAQALADVNLIRERAGLTGKALYSVGDLKGYKSVLDVVLDERRLEFAFEGLRRYDLLRSNLPTVRDYPGVHLNPSNPGVDMKAGTQIIPPDHPRIVFFLPENEVGLNPNLKQNP